MQKDVTQSSRVFLFLQRLVSSLSERGGAGEYELTILH
jgi:hypothetical protein